MKLLLHMCCAPCAMYPISVLQDENIEFEGIFYNPNIHPYEEFLRRKENVEKLSQLKNIPVSYINEFKQQTWQNFAGNEEQRCNMCYSMRFDEVASFAKMKGFDAFTTTLLVSPYQKHMLIKELCEKIAEKYNIKFYYQDFRPGFRQGQQMAKDIELYRQKFCGCIISYNKSLNNRKK